LNKLRNKHKIDYQKLQEKAKSKKYPHLHPFSKNVSTPPNLQISRKNLLSNQQGNLQSINKNKNKSPYPIKCLPTNWKNPNRRKTFPQSQPPRTSNPHSKRETFTPTPNC
jgi:hypothetical protein